MFNNNNTIAVAEFQLMLAFRHLPGGFKMVDGIVQNLDGEQLLQAFSQGVCFVSLINYVSIFVVETNI